MSENLDTHCCWYVDSTVHPHVYGFTHWEVTYDSYSEHKTSPNGSSSSSWGYRDLQFNLVSTDTGTVSRSDLSDFIIGHNDITRMKSRDCFIFDNTGEMNTLGSQIAKDNKMNSKRVLYGEREGSRAEQILKYGSVLNKGLFQVPEIFMSLPDLIFDDCGSDNLIDPLVTDEVFTHPLTESLLIACYALEKQISEGMYRGGGIFTGAPRVQSLRLDRYSPGSYRNWMRGF